MPQFRPLLRLAVLTLVGCVTGRLVAADLVVAPDGDDGAAGNVTAPLATIDAAFARARPGDRILLRAGVHAPPGRAASGTAEAPITLAAYDGGEGPESALITTGRVLPAAGWRPEGPRFRLPLADPPAFASAWLVGDGAGAIHPEACWPNHAEPPRLRMPTDFAFADQVTTSLIEPDGKEVSRAVLTDANPLAALPADALVGAELLLMPQNLWVGRRLRVTASGGEGDGLVLTAEAPGRHVAKPRSRGVRFQAGSIYRLQGPPALLDVAGEWAIDGDELLFHPPAGFDPRGERLRLVVRRAWRLGDTSHLVIEDLAFEGLALLFGKDSRHCRLRRLRLGNLPGTGAAALTIRGEGHVIEDCDVAWSDSPGIGLRRDSARCTVRNTTVIGTARLAGLGIVLQGPGHRLEQCTVRGAATHAVGLGVGSVGTRILRCDVSFAGMLQSDIAGINTFDAGHFKDAEIAWNRVHDIVAVTHDDVPEGEKGGWHGGMGIRIDNGTPIRGLGSSGIRIHHNLIWNTSRDRAIADWAVGKGAEGWEDRQVLIAHNSVAGSIWITAINLKGPTSWRGTRLLNNAVELGRIKRRDRVVHVHRKGTSLEGLTMEANVVAKTGSYFADAAGGDLRPTGAKATELVDAGVVIPDLEHPVVGDAPDIGALEAGQAMWVAGALLRPQDLAGLRVAIAGGTGVITGLPAGRSFPAGSRVRLADGREAAIRAVYDDATGHHRGEFAATGGGEVEAILLAP